MGSYVGGGAMRSFEATVASETDSPTPPDNSIPYMVIAIYGKYRVVAACVVLLVDGPSPPK